ncbi:hypothetical protein P43SY_009864 [Pythium insidiosum]|uniref:Cytoplasmic dynein 2 light intermediate chain 1 n=1 Tax=Pythium insidiosum TaxID=114742 RepID=A0AAD5LL38_PYTIN|nr:hypothetical protein P43SY_009864 [Pythium insidiosum]
MERKGSERSRSSDAKTTNSLSSTVASTKDIWLLLSALEPTVAPSKDDDALADAAAAVAPEERDTYTLLVGSKGAGKTSLLSAFRSSTKPEEIKPTTALDYVFVRLKAASATARPAVAHLWELAAAKCITEMMRVPLAPERVLNGALVVVLDLSAPGDVVPYLIKWLLTLYRVVHEILKAKERNPVEKAGVERLRQDAMARYGATHPDRDEVTPLPLPLLVVGNKWDAFRDEDSVKRKGVTQALRFLAHQYGATLLFTSTKDKSCVTQFRGVMKAFAFRAGGGPKGAKDVDPARPLFVPAGADLFEDIGFPKTARKTEFSREQHEEKARQWKRIAAEYYTPSGDVSDAWPGSSGASSSGGGGSGSGSGGSALESDGDAKDADGSARRETYPEPNIDRVRQRKAEELRRYREHRKKLLEKKAKAAA